MKSDIQPDEPKQNPFVMLPCCGAKTRAGKPCKQPATQKGRCYLHGGAWGSGAPFGNRNAWKHGQRSAAAIAERKAIRALIRESKAHLEQMIQ